MIYVDDMRAPFGRMVMCHMIADSTEELLQMVDRIGLNRRWIQKEGTYQEHYDVSTVLRRKAIAAGAVPLSQRDLVKNVGQARRP